MREGSPVQQGRPAGPAASDHPAERSRSRCRRSGLGRSVGSTGREPGRSGGGATAAAPGRCPPPGARLAGRGAGSHHRPRPAVRRGAHAPPGERCSASHWTRGISPSPWAAPIPWSWSSGWSSGTSAGSARDRKCVSGSMPFPSGPSPAGYLAVGQLPAVDEEGVRYPIRAAVANPDGLLRPSMAAYVRVLTEPASSSHAGVPGTARWARLAWWRIWS